MPHLRDLCEISSGFSFRGSVIDEPGGTYRVVQLGDVDWEAERVAWEDLPRVGGIDPGPHHLLRAGDILFAAKGRTNRAVFVPDDGPAVAASTFFVVRPIRTDVLAAYVGWYVNTAPAQAHFQTCSRGTNLRSVSKSCLGSLDVPLPPVDIQRRIAEAARLAREERELSDRLVAKRAALVEAACLRLTTTQPLITRPAH